MNTELLLKHRRVLAITGVVLIFCLFRSCSSSEDIGFRLFDPATGLPVASVTMPEGWILGGKSTWNVGQVREHSCYLFARSADGKHTMYINPVYTYTPHIRYNISITEKLDWESEYIQHPKYFGWAVADNLARTYGIDRLILKSAEIWDETPPDWMLQLWGNPERYRYGTVHLEFSVLCRGSNRPSDDDDDSYPDHDHQGPVVVCAEGQWFSLDYGSGLQSASLSNFVSVYSPFDIDEGIDYMRKFSKSLFYEPQIVQYINSVTTRDTRAFVTAMNEEHEVAMQMAARESARQDARVDEFCRYLKDEQFVVNPMNGNVYSADARYDTTMMSSDGTMIQFNKSDMPADFSPEKGFTIGPREFHLTSEYQDPRLK